MKNVRILDCTLRDGGRIIDCAFDNEETRDISFRLSASKIDIVEVGFLRDWRKVHYEGNSTFFTEVNQIKPFLDKSSGTMYVAFIDYGMFDFNSLKPFDGESIDGIRFGFTKKNYNDDYDGILRCMNVIKEKGYKLFIQGVNSLNYTDKEILEIIEMVNQVHPYSFGIVDTYGAMYIDDVDRLYGLIDRNMSGDICINFHSHNNYQLSFGFAQEVIRLSRGTSRQIIIDSTLYGMGKVAGNLNTELLVDYLVRKMHYDYEFDDILDLIDDRIYKYTLKNKWGYSIPGIMAGIYKSHPNNIIYLTEKFRLDTKDIGRILSMIDPEVRQRYDYDNIEKLYAEYSSEKVDDRSVIAHLRSIFSSKEIFVMAPGNSLNEYKMMIDDYIKSHDVVVVGVNFVPRDYKDAFCFFGNQKRYNRSRKKRHIGKTIVTSNIISSDKQDYKIDYCSVVDRGYKYFDNSVIMLLNLLKRLNPSKITIAGFDGFDDKKKDNYVSADFQNDRHLCEFEIMNKEVAQMYSEIKKTLSEKCEMKIITPSVYETFGGGYCLTEINPCAGAFGRITFSSEVAA